MTKDLEKLFGSPMIKAYKIGTKIEEAIFWSWRKAGLTSREEFKR